MKLSPHDVARATPRTQPPVSPGDRVCGYGVMGMPFRSGDYLALRDWRESSFGPAYRSVWHRSPDGDWTVYSNAPPDLSCPRFLSSAIYRSVTTTIAIGWEDHQSVQVNVAGGGIEWRFRVAGAPIPSVLSTTASLMPDWAWRSDLVLRWVGFSAALMLRTGRMRLAGTMPNGHTYQLAPTRMWYAREASASITGRDCGPSHPIHPQARIGDLLLPQRGIFYAATTARFRCRQGTVNAGTAPTEHKEQTT